MTNLLTLGGVTPAVDFHDPTKIMGWKFISPPNVTREKTVTSIGCGNAPGMTAVLSKDRELYRTRSYRVTCTDSGGSFWAAEQNALVFQAEIDAAKAYGLDRTQGHQVWLVRQLYDEPTPRVWTVLTGQYLEIEEERYGIGQPFGGLPQFQIVIQLDVMAGARSLDGSGFPIG